MVDVVPRNERQERMLRKSKRGLIRASWFRIVEAWIASTVFILLAFQMNLNTSEIAVGLAIALTIALILDLQVRLGAHALLGPNPSNSAPAVLRHALGEAAAPLGLLASRIFPRHMRTRAGTIHAGFAAGALPTSQGTVVILGDAVMERSRDAARASATVGERRFAFDEVRAVLGHELAHNLPGTFASSRILSIPYRFSNVAHFTLFWVTVAAEGLLIGMAGTAIIGVLRITTTRKPAAKEFTAVLNFVSAIAATLVTGGSIWLLVTYIMWPVLRPLPAMFFQRQIEKWCDEVAIRSGADPSALARMLQRFEPEHVRWRQPDFWESLTATHPPLHKRIVDLDHAQVR